MMSRKEAKNKNCLLVEGRQIWSRDNIVQQTVPYGGSSINSNLVIRNSDSVFRQQKNVKVYLEQVR